jgi:hypothetical protein
MNSVEFRLVDLKKIVDSMTVVYNAKVAEEKKKDSGKAKKGKEKPKMAKNVDNSRNNNPAMVANLLGDEDDYGDEYGDYGDYGDEEGATKGKAKEAEA